MKILIRKSHFAMAAFSALVVTACGVGGGIAGIGGSGYISTGTITSFGSVFVNGVEFETNASTFEIEDNVNLSQSDLRIGMVVEVSGSINTDGISGTATHIKYGDDLEGPVSGLVAGLSTTQFTIFGTQIVISEASTTFEDTTFANISDGNVLEVSGFYDQNNVLQASYIEFKSENSEPGSIFEIKGKISNLNANVNVNDFMVQGIAVNASGATIEELPNGLQNGLLVEVKGTYVDNVLVATEIEGEDSFSDEANIELEGIITRYVNNSDFDINGQAANAQNAIFSPQSLMLEVGLKVEVKGQLIDGVFVVSEIEAREGSAEVSAIVSAKSSNSFTLDVLNGQLVTVLLTTATRIEDEIVSDDNLQISVFLESLTMGDFVSVQGFESASTTITATEVRRESEVSETLLKGIVTAATPINFTVLGVTYPVAVTTTYNGADNNAAFINLIELGVSVISISDETPNDSVADEVEIED